MLTILVFLAVLVVLVLVHEAGHAVVARLTGCRVEEFGIGFPPRLWTYQVGETTYSLNLVPLGGFVRITGEDGAAHNDPRSFSRRPRAARMAILLAGVAMNLVLAVALFALLAGIGSPVPLHGAPDSLPLTDRRVELVEVSDNPVLQRAGLKAGDALNIVGGRKVQSAEDAAAAVRGFTGTALTLVLSREGREVQTTLQFPEPHVPGEPVGLSLLDVGTYKVPWRRAPAEGIRSTARTIQITALGIAKLFRDAVVEQVVPQDIAGPVGIASIVGAVSRQGLLPLMELTAVLSVNLALINVLPIPALDGGRVLFVLLEALGIRVFQGRPERLAHAIGFALLIGLIVLITISDIRRLFTT